MSFSTIQEFIRDYHSKNRSEDEVEDINWELMIEGYPFVYLKLKPYLTYLDVIQWCIDTFGIEHFAYEANCFWFENERDRLLFNLKWN